jgi:hypothetical protein
MQSVSVRCIFFTVDVFPHQKNNEMGVPVEEKMPMPNQVRPHAGEAEGMAHGLLGGADLISWIGACDTIQERCDAILQLQWLLRKDVGGRLK